MAKSTKCAKCVELKDELELLKCKLKTEKIIYENSIDVYRESLREREYELILRECEVVREIDTLKFIIGTLTSTLEKKGLKVVGSGRDTRVVSGSIVSTTVTHKKGLTPELKVKPTNTAVLHDDVKVSSLNKVNVVCEDIIISHDIVLPISNNLSATEKKALIERGNHIVTYLNNRVKYTEDSVAYPNRRLNLMKKYPEFFVSILLLVESYPKVRGAYPWTAITNTLNSATEYSSMIASFVKDTQFKMTYLNIRNWCNYLLALIDADDVVGGKV